MDKQFKVGDIVESNYIPGVRRRILAIETDSVLVEFLNGSGTMHLYAKQFPKAWHVVKEK